MGTDAAEEDALAIQDNPFEESAPAGIEYVGSAGETQPSLQALHLLLMGTDPVTQAVLVSSEQRHAFVVTLREFRIVAVKAGFASGYGGEGPQGLSLALLAICFRGCEVREALVSSDVMDRLNKSALTNGDLGEIDEKATLRSVGEYVFPDHWELFQTGALWARAPTIMPYGLLDPRLCDLAATFWTDSDGCMMKAYRRLEDTIRNRTGLQGEGAKLLKGAFLADPAPLYWPDLSAGEAVARANLFIGAYGTFRNPRVHREPSHDREALGEFLLVNELYRLERAAVDREQAQEAGPTDAQLH